MKNKSNTPLFSSVSEQTASQTNGGHCYVGGYYRPYPVVVYHPAYYSYGVPRPSIAWLK